MIHDSFYFIHNFMVLALKIRKIEPVTHLLRLLRLFDFVMSDSKTVTRIGLDRLIFRQSVADLVFSRSLKVNLCAALALCLLYRPLSSASAELPPPSATHCLCCCYTCSYPYPRTNIICDYRRVQVLGQVLRLHYAIVLIIVLAIPAAFSAITNPL
jgi:hypothetical protein